MTTANVNLVNGVDVERLVETVNAVKANPKLAQFRFRAHTDWDGGGRCHTTIKEFFGVGQEDATRAAPFVLKGDEPSVLLGDNTAPNAVEVVLHALASCLAVGCAYNAAAQGIRVEALTFDLEGDLDLQGFLGLSDQARPGFRSIRVTYHVKADAPREKLEALCEHVQRTSPLLDIIRNPVPVSIELAD